MVKNLNDWWKDQVHAILEAKIEIVYLEYGIINRWDLIIATDISISSISRNLMHSKGVQRTDLDKEEMYREY